MIYLEEAAFMALDVFFEVVVPLLEMRPEPVSTVKSSSSSSSAAAGVGACEGERAASTRAASRHELRSTRPEA